MCEAELGESVLEKDLEVFIDNRLPISENNIGLLLVIQAQFLHVLKRRFAHGID